MNGLGVYSTATIALLAFVPVTVGSNGYPAGNAWATNNPERHKTYVTGSACTVSGVVSH